MIILSSTFHTHSHITLYFSHLTRACFSGTVIAVMHNSKKAAIMLSQFKMVGLL